ncbi:hypothetical protein NliqN6_2519 [Naganishia liquefaciens]|uniref:Bromo domain-containing protein n=1 Tax=Naganishia liquefaciens TaxID=104408 RepID=A0A8H3TRY0_9TREE|nr:hypothetical protein NliqN6_2519 [Naganishia liquefaciens]
MAPVAQKDVSVDAIAAASVLNDAGTSRRGKKRSADTPVSVDDKLDTKRLKSGDNSAQQHVISNGNDVITVQDEELVSKRREVQDFVKLVTKAVTAAKDDAGRILSAEFKHLPDKNLFVDYYEVIRSPVSLETIRSKSSHVDKFLKHYDKTKDIGGKKALLQQEYEGYTDWKEAEHDFDMMWRNAKRYNVKGAQIYEDAQKLHKLTKTLSDGFSRKISGQESGTAELPQSSSGSSLLRLPSTVYKQVKQGMKLIEATMSPDGTRSATEFFHELPDKTEYADYYHIIKNPISLAEITAKIQHRSYNDIDQWMQDVDLMCDNAMQYNMELSGIYQDAEAIKSELGQVRQAFHQASREQDADAQSTSNSTPAPGLSSGPKLKLSLVGPKERNAAAPVVRPIKDKVIRVKKPALPEKQVSKEIVASLSQYDESERAAWSATLNAKQTKELIQLMKMQDETEPARAGTEEGPTPVPKADKKVDNGETGFADTSKPRIVIPSSTRTSESQETPQKPTATPAKDLLSMASVTTVPISALKTIPKAARLPSPSGPSPPPPATHSAANRLQGQSRIVPYTAPSSLQPNSTLTSLLTKPVSNPARPAASSIYTSYTIPAPIPKPRPHMLPKILLPAQPPPLLPLIRHFSFTYDLLAPPVDSRLPTHRTELQNTIKLRNMRGITSHIVAIDRATRNVEVTAFLEEGNYNLNPLILNDRSEPIGHNDQAPLVDTMSYAPLPELSLECNGKTPKGELVHPGGDVTKRPVAHKWSFPVDPAIVNFVVEVHARRPAEEIEDGRKEVKETSMVFVNRQ